MSPNALSELLMMTTPALPLLLSRCFCLFLIHVFYMKRPLENWRPVIFVLCRLRSVLPLLLYIISSSSRSPARRQQRNFPSVI